MLFKQFIPTSPASQAVVSATSPEQVKQDADVQRLFQEQAKKDATLRRVVGIISALRASMLEPDSMKFDSIRANDDASLICIEYRARNGFGRFDMDHAVITGKKVSREASAWNEKCKKPLIDYGYAVRAL
ncbi:MAG: hypothetical protein ABI831_09805 [Betaproteobacteria bacterium]